MERRILKEVIIEQRNNIENAEKLVDREALENVSDYMDLPHAVVVSGMRRVGKSTLLKQIIDKFYGDKSFYFIDFEDERLVDFELNDFNNLKEVFIELYGKCNTFFFDEIQNVENWQRFVRRLFNSGSKVFLTGSNASLLEREISTKLTGRYLHIELLPFSFAEYLKMKGVQLTNKWYMKTEKRAEINALFNKYLVEGGMPEFVKYEKPDILERLYKDVIFRDIVVRYHIKNVKSLRELALYIFSNAGSLFTFSSLKRATNIGNVNSVKEYLSYLEESFLVFVIKGYNYSLKNQNLNPKKVYVIDNGLRNNIGFSFSANRGQYLENLVFLELKRREEEIFYYKTGNEKEIDFYVRRKKGNPLLIQVSTSLQDKKVEKREISAIIEGMKELKLKESTIITENDEKNIDISNGKIKVIPIAKWLLNKK
jgi:uncharacterized protein